MWYYPEFNPVAFHCGPLRVYWYGLMYLLGIGAGWCCLLYRIQNGYGDTQLRFWNAERLSDLIVFLVLGILVGGRLGYCFFYADLGLLQQSPWRVLQIWQGGMSFHGGLIGVAVALWCYARRTQQPLLAVSDFIVPVVPLGLATGRWGNFINGELWGRVTDVPWAMVFPRAGYLPRHPSQLYEAALEGLLLFALLWWYSSPARSEKRLSESSSYGRVTALFLMGYGVLRFGLEFLRAPDPQLGFIAWNWLTMGQLLSLPMIGLGVLLWVCKRQSV